VTGAEFPSSQLFEPMAGAVAREAPPQVSGYEPIRRLGEGSSAAVWLVEQQRPFTRLVAMKVFHAGAQSSSFVERFRMERDTLARLPRGGFCDIYDAGLCRDGRPYICMEYVDGVDLLAACAARSGDAAFLARLFAQVAEVLGEAHARDLLHLDLKPSNILVEQGDGIRVSPRIIDFGLTARAGDRTVGRGTHGFAAPEIASGGVATRASDVYSVAEILRRALEADAVARRTRLGRALLQLARRNLSADPRQRAGDGAELSAAITDAVRRERRRGNCVTAGLVLVGGSLVLGIMRADGLLSHTRQASTMESLVAREPRELAVPRDHASVQAAVNAAADGDAVRIAPGRYRERVVISGKSVSLRGERGKAATTVIDGSGCGPSVLEIMNVDPERCTVSDITITRGGVPEPKGLGFRYQQSGPKRITLERCIIRDCVSTNDAIPGGCDILGDAVFRSCAFIGNRPGYRGAALAAYNFCEVELDGCSFRDHPLGSGLLFAREDARIVVRRSVVFDSNKLSSVRKGSVTFIDCRGCRIDVAGGTGFVDGGGNDWASCPDADLDGVSDLEAAILSGAIASEADGEGHVAVDSGGG
jgi:hypothetical protein